MPKTVEVPAQDREVPNILMVGTGEYTTGWIGSRGSTSDKKKGVVALVCFDQRRLGNVGDLSMVGTNGTKFPDIRNHLQTQIGDVYRDMNVSFTSFPDDDVRRDPEAYLRAMDTMQRGDGVIIFTPDNTHFDIAKAAMERGLHTMITKPPVLTLDDHLTLIELASRSDVLADVEVHKRFDPIYADARATLRELGDFSHFRSYMTQPKLQLDTFGAWAGNGTTDISYYLNSHHVDLHVWTMEDIARPTIVSARAAKGIAIAKGYDTEDQITVSVDWESLSNPDNVGIAEYTAGWVEPTSEVHTQQRFECMQHSGKVVADQSYRGYKILRDGQQVESRNPLYMKYSPDEEGSFDGQRGYGYRSIALFIDAIAKVLNGDREVKDFERTLPTLRRTAQLTAILEAGRRSLDEDGRPMRLMYSSPKMTTPLGIAPVNYTG